MSWREQASQMAQDDLDGLVGAALPFAEEMLRKHGEFYPYGTTVSKEGEVAQLAVDLGSEHPGSAEVLGQLYAVGRARREELRAIAFVSSVAMNATDAVRVELEHSEGLALAVYLPYKVARLTKKVSLGELSAGESAPRVWGG